MRVTTSQLQLRAHGGSHPGLHRDVNEDRFHFDPARGIFIVVDGVGGHVAGEQAAAIAVAMLRARLERETGPIVERIREAIAIANKEIHRRATLRPELKGMACVLTVAVADHGWLTVGHVGDTRLYKLRQGGIEKLTRDHSPVGEREDAGELTEAEAMRHPRRNEVYRDVGSEPHEPSDPGFIDIVEAPFEPDAALLVCSDGLTDLVHSSRIAEVVRTYSGHPEEIVRALIDAANDAGGKDNVTVVYAEGPLFTENTAAAAARARQAAPVVHSADRTWRWLSLSLLISILALAGFAAFRWRELWMPSSSAGPVIVSPARTSQTIVVAAPASIGDALRGAAPGDTVIVESGEYREQVRLVSGVRLESREPRGAVIRLPGGATDGDVAVVASDVKDAVFSGFRIVGDAATPLGVGLYVRDAAVKILEIEVSGAKTTAIEFAGGAGATLIAANVHDNPGTGLAVRAGAAPRIEHSRFALNGLAARTAGAVVVEQGARPVLVANIFVGVRPESLGALSEPERHTNVFVAAEQSRPRPNTRGRGARP